MGPQGDQEVFPNELIQLEIVHVAAYADLWCVNDDEHVVRIHMDSGNVGTVFAFGDRHWMEVKLICQDRLAIVAPLGNVEPEKSVGALPQSRQLSQAGVAHSGGIDPAQLHRQSPFHIVPPPLHPAITAA
jgi:hypothetical protein